MLNVCARNGWTRPRTEHAEGATRMRPPSAARAPTLNIMAPARAHTRKGGVQEKKGAWGCHSPCVRRNGAMWRERRERRSAAETLQAQRAHRADRGHTGHVDRLEHRAPLELTCWLTRRIHQARPTVPLPIGACKRACATCGPKASSCVCCTFATLHHVGAKHVHHAVGSGCRCRCIACIRPRARTHLTCTTHDERRLR